MVGGLRIAHSLPKCLIIFLFYFGLLVFCSDKLVKFAACARGMQVFELRATVHAKLAILHLLWRLT